MHLNDTNYNKIISNNIPHLGTILVSEIIFKFGNDDPNSFKYSSEWANRPLFCKFHLPTFFVLLLLPSLFFLSLFEAEVDWSAIESTSTSTTFSASLICSLFSTVKMKMSSGLASKEKAE